MYNIIFLSKSAVNELQSCAHAMIIMRVAGRQPLKVDILIYMFYNEICYKCIYLTALLI